MVKASVGSQGWREDGHPGISTPGTGLSPGSLLSAGTLGGILFPAPVGLVSACCASKDVLGQRFCPPRSPTISFTLHPRGALPTAASLGLSASHAPLAPDPGPSTLYSGQPGHTSTSYSRTGLHLCHATLVPGSAEKLVSRRVRGWTAGRTGGGGGELR